MDERSQERIAWRSLGANAPSMEARDRRLLAIAGRRHRVFTTRQLRNLGFDHPSVQRRVCRGLLRPRYRGVYIVGPGSLTHHGEWLAAVYRAGLGSFLAAPGAAAAWDLETLRRGPHHVLTAKRSRRADGLVVHQTRHLPRSDIAVVNQIPVTSVARTIFDLTAHRDEEALAKVIAAADKRGLLNLLALHAILDRASGHRGAGKLRSVLAAYSEPDDVRRELERRFIALIRAAGLPEPQLNVLVEGQLVDAYWPLARLVIELDSWAHHGDRRAFQLDRARSNALQALGYRTLRFTWADVTRDPDGVVTTLFAMLHSTTV